MNLNQLIIDLEEIKSAINEDPERAEDLLGFVIGEISIAAQQKRAADGAKCACPEPQISTLVNPGFCIICKLPRR